MKGFAIGAVVGLCLLLNQAGAAQAKKTAKKLQESIASLQKRAEDGDARAQTELGIRYREGDGVAKDEAQAVEWYRRAAKQGYARAYFLLGTAFYNGDGVAANEEFACQWFLLAAEGGDAEGKAAFEREKTDAKPANLQSCEMRAGDTYLNGVEIPADSARGMAMYTLAAEAGNGVAALRLAHIYASGIGTRRDPAAAAQWLAVAVKARERDAYSLLGKAYETGDGVPVDLHQACELYVQGTRVNVTDSIVALADIVRDGKGVERNLREAYLLYRHAAKPGDGTAKTRVDELMPQLSKKDLKKLRESNGEYDSEFPRCK